MEEEEGATHCSSRSRMRQHRRIGHRSVVLGVRGGSMYQWTEEDFFYGKCGIIPP